MPRPRTVSPVRTLPSSSTTRHSESSVCPGVTRTRRSSPATPRRSPAARPSAPRVSVGSSARTGAETRSANVRAASVWSRWRWVSTTSSTGPQASSRSRCAGSSGPGSTTTQPACPGARRIQVLVPSSVIGDGFSARTTAAASRDGPQEPVGGVRRRRVRGARDEAAAHRSTAERVRRDDEPDALAVGPEARGHRLRTSPGGGVEQPRGRVGGGELAEHRPGRRHQRAHAVLPLVECLRGRAPAGADGLGGRAVGLLAVGHPGDEEGGVVAARHPLRRDPAGPGPQRPRRRRAPRPPAGRPRRATRRSRVAGGRRRGSSEQHAGLLVGLAHRAGDQRRGGVRRRVPAARGVLGGVGVDQALGQRLAVGRVEPAAREDRHARGERHLGGPLEQEHLDARPGGRVAHEHHRRREPQLARRTAADLVEGGPVHPEPRGQVDEVGGHPRHPRRGNGTTARRRSDVGPSPRRRGR